VRLRSWTLLAVFSLVICGCSLTVKPAGLQQDKSRQIGTVIKDWKADETAIVLAQSGNYVNLNNYVTPGLEQKLVSEINNEHALAIYAKGRGNFIVPKNGVKILSKTKAELQGCDVGSDVLVNIVNSSVLPGPDGLNPYLPTRITAVLVFNNKWWKIQSHTTTFGKC